MKTRANCTLADVGRRAGVSAATASMALRNNPRISLATQQKVRTAAKTLGYRPDPILSALVARRDQGRSRRVFANLAALIDDRLFRQTRLEWYHTLLQSMRAASQRLGYHLEELHIERDLASSSDPDRILHARGIQGVALVPTVDDFVPLSIDWNNYAAVVIGNSIHGQTLNRVGNANFASSHIICENLARLGYRRVGMAHALKQEERLRFERLGALVVEDYLPDSPLQIVPPYLPLVPDEASFLTWMRKEKPEAIIAGSDEIIPWLEKGGYRIPEDVGIAFLHRNTATNQQSAGIFQRLDICGETAIEQLHASLMRGEFGFPEVPRETLIRAHWVDGNTVRQQTAEPKKANRAKPSPPRRRESPGPRRSK